MFCASPAAKDLMLGLGRIQPDDNATDLRFVGSALTQVVRHPICHTEIGEGAAVRGDGKINPWPELSWK